MSKAARLSCLCCGFVVEVAIPDLVGAWDRQVLERSVLGTLPSFARLGLPDEVGTAGTWNRYLMITSLRTEAMPVDVCRDTRGPAPIAIVALTHVSHAAGRSLGELPHRCAVWSWSCMPERLPIR